MGEAVRRARQSGFTLAGIRRRSRNGMIAHAELRRAVSLKASRQAYCARAGAIAIIMATRERAARGGGVSIPPAIAAYRLGGCRVVMLPPTYLSRRRISDAEPICYHYSEAYQRFHQHDAVFRR